VLQSWLEKRCGGKEKGHFLTTEQVDMYITTSMKACEGGENPRITRDGGWGKGKPAVSIGIETQLSGIWTYHLRRNVLTSPIREGSVKECNDSLLRGRMKYANNPGGHGERGGILPIQRIWKGIKVPL